MAKKNKLVALQCPKCPFKSRAYTHGEALGKLSRHLTSKHKDYFSRKVKTGIRKASKGHTLDPTHNPEWLTKLLGSIFPPAQIPMIISTYKQSSPAERIAIKAGVRGSVSGLTAGAGEPLAEIILAALDIASGVS